MGFNERALVHFTLDKADAHHKMLLKFTFSLFLCVCLSSVRCADDIEAEKCDSSETSSCGCSGTSRQTGADTSDDKLIQEAGAGGESVEADDEDGSVEVENDDGPEQVVREFSATLAENVKTKLARTNQMVFVRGGTASFGVVKPIMVQDGEGPARDVTLNSFYIDIHETSNIEFELFVNATNYKTEVCILLKK